MGAQQWLPQLGWITISCGEQHSKAFSLSPRPVGRRSASRSFMRNLQTALYCALHKMLVPLERLSILSCGNNMLLCVLLGFTMMECHKVAYRYKVKGKV